jgi:hypothetical protein
VGAGGALLAALVVAGCGGGSPPATPSPSPASQPAVPGTAVATAAPAPSGVRAAVEPRCPAPAAIPPIPVATLSDGTTSVEAVVGPGLVRVCGAAVPIEGPAAPPAETVLAPGSASISLPSGWQIVRWDALATDLPHLVRLPAGSGEPTGRPSAIRDAIGLWPGERYLLDVSIVAVDEAGTTVVSATYGFRVRVP